MVGSIHKNTLYYTLWFAFFFRKTEPSYLVFSIYDKR